ncbi:MULTISPECIES: alpha/beta fold hydrolase [Mycobacterium]|uniref:alpha/beta fold hydrolase n=1 Tax=Mycobacterium TaxID=1763 RepID=UPI000BAF5B02|nr:alpha/beta hydrolase [Mycobacterium avium]PBA03704.1 alpha/beta hydrolase [Mycobacterium avium]
MTVCAGRTARGARVVQHTILTRDGVALAVYDSGPVDADRTVLLLHGLCQGSQSWDLVVESLGDRLGQATRIIRYDHRGHGNSAHAPIRSYHTEQLADDLSDVLTAMRVRGELTIAGHSLGGMAALTFGARPAHRQPVRPHGLILVATAAGDLGHYGLGRLLRTPAPDILAGLVAHTPAGAVERAARRAARPLCELVGLCRGCARVERAVLCAMCSAALASTSLSTAAGFLPGLRGYDQRAKLGNIGALTTVISGDVDVLTPPAHAVLMAAGIAGARHRRVGNAGHMLLHEAPREVADEIAGVVAMGSIVRRGQAETVGVRSLAG